MATPSIPGQPHWVSRRAGTSTKRQRDEDDHAEVAPKRNKVTGPDNFAKLSDELNVKVLSHLPMKQLVACQRVSKKFAQIATDSQLWKELYYNTFVRPRASRLPGIRDGKDNKLHFSSKAAKWLNEDHLIKNPDETDWKRQYRLRHNWSKGACSLKEVPVAEQTSVPPVLVQMHGKIIYTADCKDGLRAWTARGNRKMIAHAPLPNTDGSNAPTALAVDSSATGSGGSKITLGFEDGSFALYEFSADVESFQRLYAHAPSSNGVISSIALCWPYVVTLTASQVLSLYNFPGRDEGSSENTLNDPLLLQSIKSHTSWPPMTTALRVLAQEVVVSLAFSQPTYLSGSTVAIQEFRLSVDGTMHKSRMVSAIDQHYRPLAPALNPSVPHLSAPSTSEIRSQPTSISYTHPYLLVSHPDKTLTLYLVHSDPEHFSIGAGTRLWGHTSSVSGVHVGGHGKAVSVSTRGDELWVWELEGGFTSALRQRKLAEGDMSVRIVPGKVSTDSVAKAQAGIDLVHGEENGNPKQQAHENDENKLTLTRGWVGFDDENVVVLKERSGGKQALAFYDFT
ncbi:hypothetical protein MBLNU230_g7652t1 [Neophaeotheca triangularis]